MLPKKIVNGFKRSILQKKFVSISKIFRKYFMENCEIASIFLAYSKFWKCLKGISRFYEVDNKSIEHCYKISSTTGNNH